MTPIRYQLTFVAGYLLYAIGMSVAILMLVWSIPVMILDPVTAWLQKKSEAWIEQRKEWLSYHRMTPARYASAWVCHVSLSKGDKASLQDVTDCIRNVKRGAQRRYHSQHHWSEAQWAEFEAEMLRQTPSNWKP